MQKPESPSAIIFRYLFYNLGKKNHHDLSSIL